MRGGPSTNGTLAIPRPVIDDPLDALVGPTTVLDEPSPLSIEDGLPRLADSEAIREAFLETWEILSDALGLGIDGDHALTGLRDLVVYDIPDGTRSTLTVPVGYEIEMDAGLYCLGFVHTLASLGARTSVVMTHTAYNRERGPEDIRRFLQIMARGIQPFQTYARKHGISINLHGLRPEYELGRALRDAFPVPTRSAFDAHFLLDYEEEWFLTSEGRTALEALPEIDVVLRHTKLQVSGGWIPTRMRKAAFVYSQNGTVLSNWTFDEYASMIAVTYLAHVLQRGEALSKSYVSIDEIKSRYRNRELRLWQRTVRVRP